MKLHFLRYFTVLAEELHFGRAAQRLAITQPPLSSAIKALEEELGVQLLSRSSKHVELTSAGAAFLDEARQILERVARASSVAKAVAGGMRGRLDIGMTGSQVYREVPTIVQDFAVAWPAIEVVLHEMGTAEQLVAVLHGQLHAGFVNVGAVPPQLESLALADDEFVLCLPQDHPRACQDKVDLRDMAGERFVMFSREVSPANYDNVIAIFSRSGIHPRTVHAARQWLTISAMVAQGLGIAVVPSSISRSRVAGVCFVPFSGASVASPAMLVWNPGQLNPALASFLHSAAATRHRLGTQTPTRSSRSKAGRR
ncbi:LysR family transcriptional regulator [Variovorax paradoxus]|nr:LysR family transcriptional regulator [Variovorax paradoxus]MBT2305538.1 LysR family transcriptional regulator [Variovorax paradoxus]